MNRILVFLAGVAGLGVLTACNTIEGAGRDLQAGGRFVTNSAQQVEAELND